MKDSSGGSRGEARGTPPPPPPLFWVKKEELTEGKMADRASKSRHPRPLAQGLDPPLDSTKKYITWVISAFHFYLKKICLFACTRMVYYLVLGAFKNVTL